ncbi:MAG TPA: 2Fe-2S iron-sulfur cluster-binding protein, partial [Alphaproteobacteria bacterium]
MGDRHSIGHDDVSREDADNRGLHRLNPHPEADDGETSDDAGKHYREGRVPAAASDRPGSLSPRRRAARRGSAGAGVSVVRSRPAADAATHSITIAGREPALAGRADRTILDTCLRGGAPLPYNCRSGECGECMAQLVAGEVAEMPGADPAIFGDADRAAGRILTCLCFPRSDVVIEIALRDGAAAPRIETVGATVERIAWLAPEIAEVTLRPDRPVAYRAGQYFEWSVAGIAPDRAFSAANRPGGDVIVFHVRIYPD